MKYDYPMNMTQIFSLFRLFRTSTIQSSNASNFSDRIRNEVEGFCMDSFKTKRKTLKFLNEILNTYICRMTMQSIYRQYPNQSQPIGSDSWLTRPGYFRANLQW